MAMYFASTGITAVANSFFLGGAYSLPAFVSLVATTTPSTFTVGTEVTGGGYARQPVTWEFQAGTSNLKVQNSNAIVFSNLNAITPVGFNVYAANNTTRMFYGTFSANPTTTLGQNIVLPAGSLRFRLRDNGLARSSGVFRDWVSPTYREKFLGSTFGIGTYASYKFTSPRLGLITGLGTTTTAPTEVSGGSYARQALTWYSSSGQYVGFTTNATFTNLPAATLIGHGLYDSDGTWMWTNSFGGIWNYSAVASISVSAGQSFVAYAREGLFAVNASSDTVTAW